MLVAGGLVGVCLMGGYGLCLWTAWGLGDVLQFAWGFGGRGIWGGGGWCFRRVWDLGGGVFLGDLIFWGCWYGGR